MGAHDPRAVDYPPPVEGASRPPNWRETRNARKGGTTTVADSRWHGVRGCSSSCRCRRSGAAVVAAPAAHRQAHDRGCRTTLEEPTTHVALFT